ncbi:hypothetical protein ACQP06_13955 [Nocardia sp. CA-136227]|uniref:hypothetical protein n=1 Tax=Nocardia sp. CA-136227 TaxID=3239979 RepID=UPI003D97AFBF
MSNPHINFPDGMTEAQREITKSSVATHIARIGADKATLHDRAEEVELTVAAHAPLARIAEADPDAAKALQVAAERRKMHIEARAAKLTDPIRPSDLPIHFDGPTLRSGDRIFVLPFQFDWKWHDGEEPSRSSTDVQTGDVSIGVGTNGRCGGHAGFGVSFVADRTARATTRSLRSSSWDYLVSGALFGGSATSEGGMDMAVFEDGRFLQLVEDKRWRSRKSGGESASGDSGGSGLGETIEITWQMVAGRTYNINVGAWVFCEARPGAGVLSGDSYAQGNIIGKVSLISVFFG